MTKNIMDTKTIYNKVFISILLSCFLGITWTSLKQGYNKFQSNFFQKSFLIQHYNRLRYSVGDKVFPPNVLVGKDEWLIYTKGENLDDYQNVIPLFENQLGQIEKQIKLTNQIGEENNIQFLIVIAPNKETIYPDKVPDVISIIGEKSRFDQVLDEIKPYSNIQILDIRAALRNARQIQDTYYKTDTHWNYFGAYIAYTEIIRQLSQNYPELQIYPRDLLITTPSMIVFDLSRVIGAKNILVPTLILQSPWSFESITTTAELGYHGTTKNSTIKTPTILVYHDSFGLKGLNSYFPLSFETAHFIRYEDDQHFPPNAIQDFQPDIVIIEIVERNIHFLREILPLVISQ